MAAKRRKNNKQQTYIYAYVYICGLRCLFFFCQFCCYVRSRARGAGRGASPPAAPALTCRLPRAVLLPRLPGGPMPGRRCRRLLRPSSPPAPPPARLLSSPRLPIPPPPPPPPPPRWAVAHRPRHSPSAREAPPPPRGGEERKGERTADSHGYGERAAEGAHGEDAAAPRAGGRAAGHGDALLSALARPRRIGMYVCVCAGNTWTRGRRILPVRNYKKKKKLSSVERCCVAGVSGAKQKLKAAWV